MSMPERVAVAGRAGEQAGADRAAGRAGEDAPGAGARRLGGRGDAAGGPHHERLGQPAPRRRLAQPPEVAAEQRREVGVDRRRRAALVLAEARQHLVRGGDVDAGQFAAQALGDRPLVRRVEIGEEQADRDRFGAARADQLRQPLRLARGERLEHALRPDPLVRLEAQLRRRPAAPASACTAGTARAAPGGRSRAGRRSPASRSAPCARRAPPAARWSRPSSRGRRTRPRRASAPARRSTSSTAAITPSDWSSGVVGSFAVWTVSPSKRTASVKVPPTSTPSSIRRRYARQRHPRGGRPVRPEDDVDAVQLGVDRREVGAQVAAARLLALQRAGGDRRGERVGVAAQLAQLLGAPQRPGQPPDRFSRRLAWRREAPPARRRAARPPAPRPAPPARRGCRRRSTR